MASTFSKNLGLELMATGDQAGTWGDTTNINLRLIDDAIDGVVEVTAGPGGATIVTNDAPAESNGRSKVLNFSGSVGTGAVITIAPNDVEKHYFVRNNCDGPLTFSQGSGVTYKVNAGYAAVIHCDGTGTAASVFGTLSSMQLEKILVTQELRLQGPLVATAGVNVTGDMTVTGKLTVTSDTTLSGAVTVTGVATLNGAANLNGAVTCAQALDVTGLASLKGGCSVTGGITASGALNCASAAVTGVMTSGSVSTGGGTFSGGVNITAGGLVVNGDTTLLGALNRVGTETQSTNLIVYGGLFTDSFTTGNFNFKNLQGSANTQSFITCSSDQMSFGFSNPNNQPVGSFAFKCGPTTVFFLDRTIAQFGTPVYCKNSIEVQPGTPDTVGGPSISVWDPTGGPDRWYMDTVRAVAAPGSHNQWQWRFIRAGMGYVAMTFKANPGGTAPAYVRINLSLPLIDGDGNAGAAGLVAGDLYRNSLGYVLAKV